MGENPLNYPGKKLEFKEVLDITIWHASFSDHKKYLQRKERADYANLFQVRHPSSDNLL